MKKVFICSPYSGDVEKNIGIAKAACRLAIDLGYNPIAPHLYYTQFLDDNVFEDRELGVSLGLDLLKECDELFMVIVEDKLTAGMQKEAALALDKDIPLRPVYLNNLHTYVDKEVEEDE